MFKAATCNSVQSIESLPPPPAPGNGTNKAEVRKPGGREEEVPGEVFARPPPVSRAILRAESGGVRCAVCGVRCAGGRRRDKTVEQGRTEGLPLIHGRRPRAANAKRGSIAYKDAPMPRER
jgi:hypothetical protein